MMVTKRYLSPLQIVTVGLFPWLARLKAQMGAQCLAVLERIPSVIKRRGVLHWYPELGFRSPIEALLAFCLPPPLSVSITA